MRYYSTDKKFHIIGYGYKFETIRYNNGIANNNFKLGSPSNEKENESTESEFEDMSRLIQVIFISSMALKPINICWIRIRTGSKPY